MSFLPFKEPWNSFATHFCPLLKGGRGFRQHGRMGVPQGRASVRGVGAELPRLAAVVAVVPLLLLAVEFSTCAASCPRSVGDEFPAAVKQEAGPSPMGCVAPRRPDALLKHALGLRSAKT